ncbi:MAG: hypothetical protein Q7S88_01105 [Candidatus Daviesbacteria bacterium]|nr:hypothetical protein [Candidatus Daviesbacteria bacterium]
MLTREFGDIRPTTIPYLIVRPDFPQAVYHNLGEAIAERSAVDPKPVVQTLHETGNFIQNLLSRLQSSIDNRGSLTGGLDYLNLDETALATAFFVKEVYGKEYRVNSNLYKFSSAIRLAAEWRGYWSLPANLDRQRIGSTYERLDRIERFVMGLDKGPSTRSPYLVSRVEYQPTDTLINNRVVRVDQKILSTGGEISPEQWRLQGNQTESDFIPSFGRQNFLAQRDDLGKEATRLINTFHQWLPE